MLAEPVAILRGRSSVWLSRRRWGLVGFCYAVLVPILALFAYIRAFPIAWSLILSFHRWDLVSAYKPFIGLANYVTLAHDGNFLAALRNTTVYSLATVVASTVISLPLALFLSGTTRLAIVYQAIYFLPVITPMVPMAIAWKWIYDYNYGILNYALSFVGIRPIAWLTSSQVALWALIIMSVWKILGYNLILFLVGIRNIPLIYLEAADLDGATPWQRFQFVTLPLLKPILLYVLVTATINSYNVFTQVYVMTLGSQAAPGNAVRVLVYDIYQNAFAYFHMGYASAEAVILTLIVLGVTLMQFGLVRGEEA